MVAVESFEAEQVDLAQEHEDKQNIPCRPWTRIQ